MILDNIKNIKNYLAEFLASNSKIKIIILIILIFVIYACFVSFRLVIKFEKNIKNNETAPSAKSLEIIEKDINGKLLWIIKADSLKGTAGQEGFTKSTWKSVKVTVYNNLEKEKIFASSNDAILEGDPKKYIMYGDTKLELIEQNVTVLCEKLILEKNKPLILNKNIKIFKTSSPEYAINAETGHVEDKSNKIILENIPPSLVAENLVLSGNKLVYFPDSAKAEVYGNVKLVKSGPNGQVSRSEKLEIFFNSGSADKAILTINPSVTRSDGKVMTAKKIIYNIKTNNVSAEGSVKIK